VRFGRSRMDEDKGLPSAGRLAVLPLPSREWQWLRKFFVSNGSPFTGSHSALKCCLPLVYRADDLII
jgi:hypothetical protein